MVVVEKWPLWGCYQLEDLSESIRTQDKKTSGRCRELVVMGMLSIRGFE